MTNKVYPETNSAASFPNRLTVSTSELQVREPFNQARKQMQRGWDGPKGGRCPRIFWYECPMLRPVTPGQEDLTGVRFGKMVCVGLAPVNGGQVASWVARCDCGVYELRKAKTIKKRWPLEACGNCGYDFHLKRLDFKNRRGRWPNDREDEILSGVTL